MVSSIIRAGLIINFALFSTALVIPRAAPGTQFITGPCTADADCASGCCNAQTALCAAWLVALEGAGCGFGSPSAGAGAAKPVAAAATGVSTDVAAPVAVASTTVAAAASTGTQFITGACTADADCASGCCNAQTALCAARLVALEGAGCGFGSSSAGAGAAKPVAPAATSPAVASSVVIPPAAAVASTTVAAAASTGTQFITGACTADADCASGCCNAQTALCAARLVALEGAGCGFGSPSAGAGAAKPVTPAAIAASTDAATPPTAVASTTVAAAASTGTQFITGTCATDADCASGCCGKNSGLCAARAVALEGAGCGHVA